MAIVVISLRVVAALLGAAWAAPGFGIVDLSIVVLPAEWSADAAPLAVSWGSLVMFFLAVPFFAAAVRPTLGWGACALAALAAVALAITSALTAYPPLLLFAGAAAVTAAVVAALGVGAAIPGGIPPLDIRISMHWPLLVLALAGVALWIPYTADAVAAFGVLPSDVTLGLDHWPVQAGAGIAIVFAGLVSGLFPQLRSQAVAASALSAAAIGIVAIGHAPSPGATQTAFWGILAVLWAVGLGWDACRSAVISRKPADPGPDSFG